MFPCTYACPCAYVKSVTQTLQTGINQLAERWQTRFQGLAPSRPSRGREDERPWVRGYGYAILANF